MRFKSFMLAILLVLVGTASAYAQAAPTDKFRFNIDAASLATANGYRYDLELDGVILPTALVTTCINAASPFQCDAPIPAITPTSHVARVRAVDISGTTPILGPFSVALNFTMRATPSAPTGLTIVPGGTSGDDNALLFDLGTVPAPVAPEEQ